MNKKLVIEAQVLQSYKCYYLWESKGLLSFGFNLAPDVMHIGEPWPRRIYKEGDYTREEIKALWDTVLSGTFPKTTREEYLVSRWYDVQDELRRASLAGDSLEKYANKTYKRYVKTCAFTGEPHLSKLQWMLTEVPPGEVTKMPLLW